MVWIGLHGVMFLFLFSDFYKAKYTKAAQKVKANGSTANGHVKTLEKEHLLANGSISNGKLNHSNGDLVYANGNNKGACMVSWWFLIRINFLNK